MTEETRVLDIPCLPAEALDEAAKADGVTAMPEFGLQGKPIKTVPRMFLLAALCHPKADFGVVYSPEHGSVLLVCTACKTPLSALRLHRSGERMECFTMTAEQGEA
jgi:hypothetical protein